MNITKKIFSLVLSLGLIFSSMSFAYADRTPEQIIETLDKLVKTTNSPKLKALTAEVKKVPIVKNPLYRYASTPKEILINALFKKCNWSIEYIDFFSKLVEIFKKILPVEKGTGHLFCMVEDYVLAYNLLFGENSLSETQAHLNWV